MLLLAAADLLLLLFCLSNTPELQGRYARLLPAAASLDEVTAEYGHRHVGRGRRGVPLTPRPGGTGPPGPGAGAEVAAILDRYAGEEQYRAFLARYPAHRDLLVEARVHLFRRDRYAFLADQAKDDTDLRQQYARIAMGENRSWRRSSPRCSVIPVTAGRRRCGPHSRPGPARPHPTRAR